MAQDVMKEKAAAALYEYNNQYPPYAGVPELRQAVARHAERQTGMIKVQGVVGVLNATELLSISWLRAASTDPAKACKVNF